MTQRTLVDRCIRDDHGRVVIGQNPNLSLVAFFTFSILAWIFAKTTMAYLVFRVLAFGSIVVWSYLEITSGVNYFRRALGLVVLVLATMAAVSFIHR